ncbi:hypothetical protein [Parashewanella curva]|uniref:hypothetical protein n=1 Tax=Parashewanella curva TaxID=2338552 RepID=UPI001059C4FC|nr:hypothetical protein [Parashewanella curva]
MACINANLYWDLSFEQLTRQQRLKVREAIITISNLASPFKGLNLDKRQCVALSNATLKPVTPSGSTRNHQSQTFHLSAPP